MVRLVSVFGHSAATPTLYSNMGFEAIFVNRVHHSVKADRMCGLHFFLIPLGMQRQEGARICLVWRKWCQDQRSDDVRPL